MVSRRRSVYTLGVSPSSLTKDFTVFELVNEKLREIYVAHTDGPVFSVVAELRRLSAPALRHWDFHDTRPVRSIEFGLSEEDARMFVKNYTRAELPDGWRYLT